MYVFPYWANVSRMGTQDLRVLVEYGPNDIMQNLNWEGIFDDGAFPATHLYLSSGRSSDSEDQDFQPALSTEAQPALSWDVPDRASDLPWVAVAVAPQGPLVAISYGKNLKLELIELRNWQTGTLRGSISEAPAGCPELISPAFMQSPTVFLSDSRHLASMADEALVCIWDSETRRRLLIFEGHRKPRSYLGLAAGNQLSSLVAARSVPFLASADRDNVVRVWDGLSGRNILAIEPCESGPGCGSWVASSLSRLALSDDGRFLGLLQSGADGDALRLWDTTTGIEVGTMTMPVKTPPRFARLVNLAFSPDQRQLAVHLGDHIEVWSMATVARGAAKPLDIRFDLERVLIDGPPGYVPPLTPAEATQVRRSLAFSADGRRLVTGAVVWEIDRWRQLRRANSSMSAFTPDGRHLVTECCVWDLPQPSEAATPAT